MNKISIFVFLALPIDGAIGYLNFANLNLLEQFTVKGQSNLWFRILLHLNSTNSCTVFTKEIYFKKNYKLN